MSNTKKILKLTDLLKITGGENSEKFSVLNRISSDIICQYEKEDMQKYLGKNIIVRETVAKKLLEISKKLKVVNSDFKLRVVYGYRHPDVQLEYFKNKKLEIQKNNPTDTEDELNEKTHMFVADPRVGGHQSGGAVDITITTPNGDLDMGTKIADYSNEEKIQTFSLQTTEEQKNNRKLLHDLMVSEEFAPFYGEWWHFSYGDLEWTAFYKKEKSLYSTINLNLETSN